MVGRHKKTSSDTRWLWSTLLYAVIALLSFLPTAHAQASTPQSGNSSQFQLELTSTINKVLPSSTEEEKADILSKYLAVQDQQWIDKTEAVKWVLMSSAAVFSVILIFLLWNKQLSRKVKERTAALAESESRFRATFEQAAVGIAHVSPAGKFLRLNQKFCDIVGYSQEEMLERTFQEITHPEDLEADLDLVQQLICGKSNSYTIEKRYIHKDGSIVWVSLTVKILRRDDGSPHWFVSVVQDISDRLWAEEEARKSYEFMDHLTRTLPDAIFSVKLPERTVKWCSDSYGILGYEAHECIGETTEKFYPSKDHARNFGIFMDNAISNEKDIVQTELEMRRKNGEIFSAEAKLAFQKEDGRVVAVTALIRDISERKQIEKKLQENHDYLKHLVSSIPDAVFRVKLPERVIDWVEDDADIMGARNAKAMYGQPTRNYFASEDEYNDFGEMQRQAIEDGKDFMLHEIMVRRLDGTVFPAEVTASFFRENGTVKYATALVRDITERKQAEKKILDYQKRLKALASQLTLAEERERRRIAENLHDEVGQMLALSRLQLAAVPCDDPKLKGQLDDISGALRQAIRDTRQLIFELSSPSMHELGLGAAISEWGEEMIKKYKDDIGFSLVNQLSGNELDEDERMILFRNVRELLANTFKHAQAKKINIALRADDQAIRISVEDDGVGFDPAQIENAHNREGGFGLFSIEERMKDLNGTMEIDAAPLRGCRVILSLPRSPVRFRRE
jgi:PAS domain S-box-containing protein